MVESKFAFSACNNFLDEKRSKLAIDILGSIMCLEEKKDSYDWLQDYVDLVELDFNHVNLTESKKREDIVEKKFNSPLSIMQNK